MPDDGIGAVPECRFSGVAPGSVSRGGLPRISWVPKPALGPHHLAYGVQADEIELAGYLLCH
jgi:hypothetical protein